MTALVAVVVGTAAGVVVGGGAAWWWPLPHPSEVEALFRGGPLPGPDAAGVVAFVDPIRDVPIAVVARGAWDAAPVPTGRLRARAKALSSSSFIVVHHSDFSGQPGPEAILDYHRHEAGFSDIGYHFVVAGDGTVFEARPLDRVGAHAGISREQRRDATLDPDADAIGVVLDGNFEADRPAPRQLAAAITLIRDLRKRLQVPARHVIGHRDVKATVVEAAGLTFAGHETVCPGDAAFALLPAIRLLSEPSASASGVADAVVAGGAGDVVSARGTAAPRR